MLNDRAGSGLETSATYTFTYIHVHVHAPSVSSSMSESSSISGWSLNFSSRSSLGSKELSWRTRWTQEDREACILFIVFLTSSTVRLKTYATVTSVNIHYVWYTCTCTCNSVHVQYEWHMYMCVHVPARTYTHVHIPVSVFHPKNWSRRTLGGEANTIRERS